jgi:hypothetical protein
MEVEKIGRLTGEEGFVLAGGGSFSATDGIMQSAKACIFFFINSACKELFVQRSYTKLK